MTWSIDRMPVKVFVSLALLANGGLFAFLLAAAAAVRQIGAVVAQAITLVLAQIVLLPFGGHPDAKLTPPGYDPVVTLLDVAAVGALVFFPVATVLLWTRFSFYRIAALIGAAIISLAYGWFIVFSEFELAAQSSSGAGQAIAHVCLDGGLVLLAGAAILALVRGTPRHPSNGDKTTIPP